MVTCSGTISVQGNAAFQEGEEKIDILAPAENKAPLSVQISFWIR